MTNSNNPIPDLVLGGNFTVPSYSMISASGEAQSSEWIHIKGKTWDWLVQPDREAHTMLCWKDSKGRSDGFGGQTLKLKVIGELHPPSEKNRCGESFSLLMYDEPKIFEWQGPWSSNTDSLFRDTGYDIRDRIKSWGCIGKGRSWDKGNNPHATSRAIIEDLVYFDPSPQYGHWNRIRKLAEKLSDELQQTLYYYEETHGGSSSGPVNFGKFNAKQEFDAALKEMKEKEQ